YAAAPTIAFALRIESDADVRSLMLQTQIRIAAPDRAYDDATQERLRDLFGPPESWGRTLRSLLWAHATLLVAPFSGTTTVELPVACTYDFEVASAKYLHALRGGEVPLEFRFSGTLVDGEDARLDVRVRFLHVVRRQLLDRAGRSVDQLEAGGRLHVTWQEATERELTEAGSFAIPAGREREELDGGAIDRTWAALEG